MIGNDCRLGLIRRLGLVGKRNEEGVRFRRSQERAGFIGKRNEEGIRFRRSLTRRNNFPTQFGGDHVRRRRSGRLVRQESLGRVEIKFRVQVLQINSGSRLQGDSAGQIGFKVHGVGRLGVRGQQMLATLTGR